MPLNRRSSRSVASQHSKIREHLALASWLATGSSASSIGPGPGPPPSQIVSHFPVPWDSPTHACDWHSSLALQSWPSAFADAHLPASQ